MNYSEVPNRRNTFFLAFGMEVVIPIKVGMLTLHTYHNQQNGEGLESNLDWLDELRETALI